MKIIKMDGYCRGCLTKYEDPSQLIQYTEKNRRLYTYSTGLQVKPNDPLFNMCKHCFIKMKLACKFKKQCRTSDKKFSHFLTMKESEEVADFEMFLRIHDDSFTFKFPLNGSSTPSFQKAKDDDNESTCTSIRNFMTDILRAEDLPDTEAQIIQEMIAKEADVLDDSLDSHWLADDASIATDFHFSPFATPSKNDLPPPDYSPVKTVLSDNQDEGCIIDQESYIAAKKILLKTLSPIENYDVGAKKTLDSILIEEKEVAITIKKHAEAVQCEHNEVQKTVGKHFYIGNDEQEANEIVAQPKDRIDHNLEKALKDAKNTEFPLHSLLAISTPSVKSGLSGAATPLIDDILFGNKSNKEDGQTKKHVYCTDDTKEASESDPLEDFFNKETGEYIGEVKKDQAEIFDDFIPPKEESIAKEIENNYTCKICNKKFDNKKNLRIHSTLQHQVTMKSPPKKEMNDFLRPGQSKYDLSDFSCQICVKKFKSTRALKLHFIKKHKFKIETPKKSEERIEKTCDRCGKSFNRKSNLYTHIRKMHKKQKENFRCNKCSLEFSSAAKLKMHQVTHTAGTVKKYLETAAVCNICGHEATTQSNLKLHMARRHTKQHIAECEHCNKKYYRKSDLIVHMRIHTGEKPFPCQYCNTSFRRRDTLNNHMKRHTDERPHQCEYCKTKFPSRPLLNVHTRQSVTCIKLRTTLNSKDQDDQDQTQYIVKETTYVPSMGTIEELLELSPSKPKDLEMDTADKDVELPDFKEAEKLYDELSEIVLNKV